MVTEPDLTVRDLVVALGWCIHLAGTESKLAEYWQLRLRLLSQAFDLPSDWHRENGSLREMVRILAREARRGGVFSGILEYSPTSSESLLLDQHRPLIRNAETALKERLIDCAVDILSSDRPDLIGKKISIATLIELGVPAEQPAWEDFI